MLLFCIACPPHLCKHRGTGKQSYFFFLTLPDFEVERDEEDDFREEDEEDLDDDPDFTLFLEAPWDELRDELLLMDLALDINSRTLPRVERDFDDLDSLAPSLLLLLIFEDEE